MTADPPEAADPPPCSAAGEPMLGVAAALMPGLDPLALEAVVRFLRVSRAASAALDGDLAEAGLSLGKLGVLMVLGSVPPAGLAPSDVADCLGVTRGTITGLLDGLERDLLVHRETDAGDRRRQLVHLTAAGHVRLARALERHGRNIERLVGALDRDQRRSLIRLSELLDAGVAGLRG